MKAAVLRKRALPALLLIVVLVVLFTNERMFEWLYPIKFDQEISAASAEAGVDKLLLAAIIRTESNFKPDKVSVKGAVGLMQIMPDTADWVAEAADIGVPLGDQLFEPGLNVRLGAHYVRMLQHQFVNVMGRDDAESDLAIVAAAYNAGPGTVGRWLEEGTWSGLYGDSGQIPYGETRHFVARVVYYYNKYQQVYGDR